MKSTTLIFFILLSLTTRSQTVLLNVDRKTESKVVNRGPNLDKFSHFFLTGGLYSGDNPGARIIYGTSVNLGFGIRFKYKVSNIYSVGYEIENEFSDYKLRQEDGKILPDTVRNDMARFDFSSLSLGVFNRFNFDPARGNFLGTFLDIGISGEVHYSIKYITKNDGPYGTLVKTTVRHLNYTNGFNAKAFARLGFSHFSLFVSYRILDIFKSSFNYPDLPRIAAGIDLAVF